MASFEKIGIIERLQKGGKNEKEYFLDIDGNFLSSPGVYATPPYDARGNCGAH
jgi:hypothetical protein